MNNELKMLNAFLNYLKICSFIIVLLSIFMLFEKPKLFSHNEDGEKEIADIIIGILSARDHFIHRKTLRDTWLKYEETRKPNISKRRRFLYKFIIGSKACGIHDEDRRDLLSCEWQPIILSYPGDVLLAYNIIKNYSVIKSNDSIGLDFQVKHNIMVEKLVIFISNQLRDLNGHYTISIYDRISKQEIISAEFYLNSTLHANKSMLFNEANKVMLPKGFKGSLVIYSYSDEIPFFQISSSCLINDGGGLISFEKRTRHGVMPGYFPENVIERENFCHFLLGSFIYKAFDEANYKNATRQVKERMKRIELHQKKLAKEIRLLTEESKYYDDIKFVDVTDDYRHLPMKLLHFYKWVSETYDFNFTLKTDDDCFLNLPLIIKSIDEYRLKGKNKVWFSKYNWPVDKYGKWADDVYTSPVYPAFACGSGNILSNDLIEWIAKNDNYLHLYQGEDVSVGIWLSAIAPNIFNDARWSCIKSCSKEMFSLPDNSPSEIISLYKNVTLCNNPCSCF